MGDVCFVTGAGGFLGHALCHRLLADGYSVRGLDIRWPSDADFESVRPERVEGLRRPASAEPVERGGQGLVEARAGEPARFERLQGDICDREPMARGCAGAAFVFHLAALLPQRKAPPQEMRRVNVEGARTVIEASLAAGVRRLVLMSSAEVYGVPSRIPCPETAPLAPNGEYGRNKVEAERLAREAMPSGLDAVILRPPTIVGPGMPEGLLRGTLSALRHNRRIFVPSGGVRFQMVAVSDVVEACLLATSRPEAAGETLNIGSDNVPTLLGATRRLREELGSRSPIVAVPPGLARLVFRLLLALGRSPLEPEHVEIAFRDYVFDNARAKQVLGWQPQLDNVGALVACVTDAGQTDG